MLVNQTPRMTGPSTPYFFSQQRLRLGTLRNRKLRIHFKPKAGKPNPTDDGYSSTLFNFNTPYINPRFLTCLSHTRHLENRS